jgi:Spy/CpxP family protein refolding chaperone
MKPRVKGALLLLLAFLLGTAAGGLGLNLYQAWTGWGHPPRDSERSRQFVLKRLTRELDLRPEQQQQVEAILRETGQEFARLREEIGPRVREIREHSRERIRAILNPEQQTKFETLANQWERQAEGHRHRIRGPMEGETKAR